MKTSLNIPESRYAARLNSGLAFKWETPGDIALPEHLMKSGCMEHFDRTEFAVGLVRVVALHDEETATHLRATAILSRRIAAHMQLSAETTDAAGLGGLLHDIGKIRVERRILCKPAELTDAEWVDMRSHAQCGGEVLAALPMLANLAPIVRAHHERMDGQGYPDGLRGDEIPLEARIVAVADAFHALTTDRPYRHAILPHIALHVIEAEAGPQFDPAVVRATLELFDHSHARQRLTA